MRGKGRQGTHADVNPAAALQGDVGEQILRAVRSIRYGSVEVTVHAGKVVQIERKEKVRLDAVLKDEAPSSRPRVPEQATAREAQEQS